MGRDERTRRERRHARRVRSPASGNGRRRGICEGGRLVDLRGTTTYWPRPLKMVEYSEHVEEKDKKIYIVVGTLHCCRKNSPVNKSELPISDE